MGTRQLPLVAGLLGALLAGGALSACATGPGSPMSPGGSVSSTASPSAGGSGNQSGSPSRSSPASAGNPAELTVTGVVEDGVEAGCIVLRADAKTYVLVGGDRGVLHSGARVTVRGRLNPQLVSYCMQGDLFEVSAAQPA